MLVLLLSVRLRDLPSLEAPEDMVDLRLLVPECPVLQVLCSLLLCVWVRVRLALVLLRDPCRAHRRARVTRMVRFALRPMCVMPLCVPLSRVRVVVIESSVRERFPVFVEGLCCILASRLRRWVSPVEVALVVCPVVRSPELWSVAVLLVRVRVPPRVC